VSDTDTANDFGFTGTQSQPYVAKRHNRGSTAASTDVAPQADVDEVAAAAGLSYHG
jgi:hypothetical protein